MDSTDRRHQRQNSNTSLLATIQAAIHLAYYIDPNVVYRVAFEMTHVHTIKNANVIAVPLPRQRIEDHTVTTEPT